jgi:DNA mismatch endonuclease, patch repair protein
MVANCSVDTKPERRLRSELHRRGFRFRKHLRPVPGLRCKPDIVFPRDRVAVFVDGCFWHGCPLHGRRPSTNAAYWATKIERNVARDQANSDVLRGDGWRVVRVWEHEALVDAADAVIAVIQEVGG